MDFANKFFEVSLLSSCKTALMQAWQYFFVPRTPTNEPVALRWAKPLQVGASSPTCRKCNACDWLCLRRKSQRTRLNLKTFSKSFQKRQPLEFLRPPQNHPDMPQISLSVLKFSLNAITCVFCGCHTNREWQLPRGCKLKDRSHCEIARTKRLSFCTPEAFLEGHLSEGELLIGQP